MNWNLDFFVSAARLGLTTHADPELVSGGELDDYIATNSQYHHSVSDALQEANQIRHIALHRGDFTPLTAPYKSLGAMTVFDEFLIRQALRSRIVSHNCNRQN